MVLGHSYRFILTMILIFRTVHSFSIKVDEDKLQDVKVTTSFEEEDDEDDGDDVNDLSYGIMSDLFNSWNDCVDERKDIRNTSVTCQGVRIVGKVITQLLDSQKSLQISKGLQIVKVEESNAVGRELDDGDSSLLARLGKFVQHHELRVRLPELLPSSEDWGSYLLGAVETNGYKGNGTGRKKNKGMEGMMLMFAMMKAAGMTMALAAVGFLAMKALGVAGIALMLAGLSALKKLTSKDDDGGHHVSVVPVHHGGDYGHGHRRKREDLTYLMPYRGYYRQ